MAETTSNRDLILVPGEFAFILDSTKGYINIHTGATKQSLSATDIPIVFDKATKKFVQLSSLEGCKQRFCTAPENYYIVLKNPASDNAHPAPDKVSLMPELQVGKKINIAGPSSFALWPGQMVDVIQGHQLKSNEYLLVRVYDEKSAKENWNQAILKDADGKDVTNDKLNISTKSLSLGKQFVIKGTEISFFIPPTGISVIPEAPGKFIRNAVTLERLEYCILLDESGTKRYEKGPQVVFPSASEHFVETKDGYRKYRAVELSEIKGLYIKVIADYKDEKSLKTRRAGKDIDTKEFLEGDELFITGKEMMIYFPRPEHAIIKYGENDVHYAVAIPKGQGRYILNRLTGDIKLVKGPNMYLCDPRTEIVVKRILDANQVSLWYPGNQKALEYNLSNTQKKKQFAKAPDAASFKMSRQSSTSGKGADRVMYAAAAISPDSMADYDTADFFSSITEPVAEGMGGESFDRSSTFTPPRSITLDTKFEGAVSVQPWSGYAIMVISQTGERNVVIGPQTKLLEYDETLEVLKLSTGNPKNNNQVLYTVYLRVLNNRVSDLFDVETKDYIKARIKLAYNLNFIGDEKIWFNVENYVKLLTERFRSLLRSETKELSIKDFYEHGNTIIKNLVMGEDQKGTFFPENNMQVFDVEVEDIQILDNTVRDLFINVQRNLMNQDAQIVQAKSHLEATKQIEEANTRVAENRAMNQLRIIEIEKESSIKTHELETLRFENAKVINEIKGNLEKDKVNQEKEVNEIKLIMEKATALLESDISKMQLDQRLIELNAEAKATIDKFTAITPDLITALQSASEKYALAEISKNFNMISVLGQTPVATAFQEVFKGTQLQGVIADLGKVKELTDKK